MGFIAKINKFVGSQTKAYVRNMLRYLLILVVSLASLITVFIIKNGDIEDVGAMMAGLVAGTFIVKMIRYNRQFAFTLLEYTGKEDFEIKSLWLGGVIKEIKSTVNPVVFFFKKIGVVLLISIPFVIATVVMFSIFKPVVNIQFLVGSVGLLFIMFLNNAIVEPLLAVCEITD